MRHCHLRRHLNTAGDRFLRGVSGKVYLRQLRSFWPRFAAPIKEMLSFDWQRAAVTSARYATCGSTMKRPS